MITVSYRTSWACLSATGPNHGCDGNAADDEDKQIFGKDYYTFCSCWCHSKYAVFTEMDNVRRIRNGV